MKEIINAREVSTTKILVEYLQEFEEDHGSAVALGAKAALARFKPDYFVGDKDFKQTIGGYESVILQGDKRNLGNLIDSSDIIITTKDKSEHIKKHAHVILLDKQ